MKKFTKLTAIVLTLALVLSSFMVPAMTTATGSTSNWYVSAGGELSNEKSEIWVIDTATVHLVKKDGFVQNTQKLTELIGTDGKDGKGYINVVIEDGTAAKFNSLGYCVVQLVGSSDTSSAVDHATTTSKGMNWYIRSDETGEAGSAVVYNKSANGKVATYGKFADIAKAGVRFLFTTKEDGLVYIRSNGVGAADTFHNYEVTASKDLKSEAKLSTIKGDNNETGEDGVYARFHTKTNSVDLNVTVSVAYPMPADYNPNVSHWAVGGGSTIVSQSTEYLAVDTVTVKLPAQGYLQHKEKLTDLIGADGQDGKGFINVIVEDGSVAKAKECYVQMMLVGKADPTVSVPNNALTNQGFSWYLRPDGNTHANTNYSETQGRICNATASTASGSNPANEYGRWEDFGVEGFRFAFSADSEERVLARGIGNGIIGNAYKSSTNDYTGTPFYNVTKYSQSVKMATKLSDVQGDNGETAADGVYYRLHSRRGTATMSFTTTVAYPCEAPEVNTPPVTPTPTPTGPVNLVPADLFASKANMQEWFGGTISDNAADFFEEGGEYIYKAPKGTASWPYTIKEFPDGSFTVKLEIKPTVYESSGVQKYSGMGILLGYGNTTGLPWMNIRFDADYATKKMMFYIWEHDGTTTPATQKQYGTEWYEGEFPEDMWFEVIMEFTPNGTKIYLDGYETPLLTDGHTPGDRSLGHFPTAAELKYIGFFPSSDVNYIKNFEVYEGVGLQLGALAPSNPGQIPNKPTGDHSMALIAMAMVLSAGAYVVLTKRRSYAK